jgi:hypothetical protein
MSKSSLLEKGVEMCASCLTLQVGAVNENRIVDL